MKLNIQLLLAVLCLHSFVLYGQVGIGTNKPKVSLGVNHSGAGPVGILTPRITGDDLQELDEFYGQEQDGTIVYVLKAVTVVSPKTKNITAIGHYLYDAEAEEWLSLGSGVEPWYDVLTDKGAVKNTDDIYQIGRVATGTISIDPSAQFEVKSTNKGVLISRLSTEQRSKIEDPADGLVIFNTDTQCINFYDGHMLSWKSLCGSIYDDAVAEATCSVALDAQGTYSVGSALTQENYIQLPVTVTKAGSLVITITTKNGYSFSYSNPVINAGDHELMLMGMGIPSVATASEEVEIKINGYTADCKVNIEVAPFKEPIVYTLDCGSIKANGSYKKGQGLTASNTITVQVTNTNLTAPTPVYLTTDTVEGIKFTGSSVIPAGATSTVTLVGSGAPTSSGTINLSISANNVVQSTCPVSIFSADESLQRSVRVFAIVFPTNLSIKAKIDAGSRYSANLMGHNLHYFGPKGVVAINPSEGKLPLTVFNSTSSSITVSGQTLLDRYDIIIVQGTISNIRTMESLSVFMEGGGVVIFANNKEDLIDYFFREATGVAAKSVTRKRMLPHASDIRRDAYAAATNNVDHPILNGPFGDIRGKFIGQGQDEISFVTTYPATSKVLMADPMNATNAYILVDDTKNFAFIGDSYFSWGGEGVVSKPTTSYPAQSLAGEAVTKPYKYTGLADVDPQNVNVDIHNSTLFVNLLAWAIDKAQRNGRIE